jgi:hypothetical protein
VKHFSLREVIEIIMRVSRRRRRLISLSLPVMRALTGYLETERKRFSRLLAFGWIYVGSQPDLRCKIACRVIFGLIAGTFLLTG